MGKRYLSRQVKFCDYEDWDRLSLITPLLVSVAVSLKLDRIPLAPTDSLETESLERDILIRDRAGGRGMLGFRHALVEVIPATRSRRCAA